MIGSQGSSGREGEGAGHGRRLDRGGDRRRCQGSILGRKQFCEDVSERRFGHPGREFLRGSQFLPVGAGKDRADRREALSLLWLREPAEFGGEDLFEMLTDRIPEPVLSRLNHFGKGLGDQAGAAHGPSLFKALASSFYEGSDAVREGPLVLKGGKVREHAFHLDRGRLVQQAFHIFKVSEDGSRRDARSQGDLLGRGAERARLQAVEHGLGHTLPGPFRARMSSIGCAHVGILYCHTE